MIFELRTYTANPGKLDKLEARFRDHTRGLFEKHGMKSIGYWLQVAPEEGKNAEKNWAAFRADPEWIKAKGDSEVDGLLVAGLKSQYMTATDYSAIQ